MSRGLGLRSGVVRSAWGVGSRRCGRAACSAVSDVITFALPSLCPSLWHSRASVLPSLRLARPCPSRSLEMLA
eukprot:3014313-Rhodomonas_salina.4